MPVTLRDRRASELGRVGCEILVGVGLPRDSNTRNQPPSAGTEASDLAGYHLSRGPTANAATGAQPMISPRLVWSRPAVQPLPLACFNVAIQNVDVRVFPSGEAINIAIATTTAAEQRLTAKLVRQRVAAHRPHADPSEQRLIGVLRHTTEPRPQLRVGAENCARLGLLETPKTLSCQKLPRLRKHAFSRDDSPTAHVSIARESPDPAQISSAGGSVAAESTTATMPSSRDIELKLYPLKEDSFAHGTNYSMREPMYEDPQPQGMLARWMDGFRRDTGYTITPKDPFDEILATEVGSIHPPPLEQNGGSHYYDMRLATLRTAQSSLARKLKGRHLQMIAIGGSIGTGLFVASGRALQTGGPAAVLIAYTLVGAMLYFTCQALGELAVAFPVAGSFSAFSTRFLDPSWGFAMGWNYILQWIVVLPLEIIAAAITISYWNPHLPRAIFVTIFLLTVVVINLFGVKGYGEAEFIMAIVKVTAVIGFILLGIVLNIGGTPDGGYIGGQYWQTPGAFHNGFKGLCSVFVMAAFAFAGTELVGLAAAETINPRKSLPTAIKQVFWRITLFYIVALTLIGLLVPYNDERLLADDTRPNTGASPFVIAIENAGIEILPSVMNVVILIAVLSVGNSSVFGSSRTLAALADQGQAPRILSYIDRRGRPLVAILVSLSVGLLAYLADTASQSTVFDWLLAIAGLSSIFTWASICLAHIRFRKAWAAKGHSLRELAFKAQCGVWGSWVGFVLNVLVLIAQFWVGAWPVDYDTMSSRDLAENFFLQYMAAPIVILFYLAHRLYFRTSLVHIEDMDIDTGRRDFNLPILVAQESEERRTWPKWKRLYKYLC
ncbi:uncharacterized protein JN550_010262 [Neoarthrinium moseri]|uniref:uncharacterized protein n=1 Tax=Neoarthrinium moseri TaxID=1658444 RepID=UPI001FDCD7A8|nr:uncharacterized protein JN550_010262 [Neoarthrinium moseri]KAI1862255.1 hypothetical protein JN550_010262 [Neoarthrinium moseri]